MHKNRKMALNIVSKTDKNTDLQYWLSQSPEKRIEAVEFLRTQYYALYGHKSIPRFIPSIRIVERRHKDLADLEALDSLDQ